MLVKGTPAVHAVYFSGTNPILVCMKKLTLKFKCVHELLDNDDPMSWTEPYFQTDFNGNNSNTWNSVPKEVWEKTPLEDMKLATHAIETLQKVSTASDN